MSDSGGGSLSGQGLDPPASGLWRLPGAADPGPRGPGHPPLPRLPQQQPGAQDGRVTEKLVISVNTWQCLTLT